MYLGLRNQYVQDENFMISKEPNSIFKKFNINMIKTSETNMNKMITSRFHMNKVEEANMGMMKTS